MANGSTQKVVAIVLIVVAAIVLLWVLGMLMMPSMMGGMMGGGMMGDGMMAGCAICVIGPLLLVAILVTLAVVLLRIKT